MVAQQSGHGSQERHQRRSFEESTPLGFVPGEQGHGIFKIICIHRHDPVPMQSGIETINALTHQEFGAGCITHGHDRGHGYRKVNGLSVVYR
ncbi:hypothetical protein D3C79_905920 [compost metagenome]